MRPIRKHFYERMGRHGFNDVEVDAALAQLRSTLVRMESRLENETWISGDVFGLADIIVLPLIDRMEDLSLDAVWKEGFANVTDWLARSKARKSFDVAFYAQTRLSEFLPIGPLRP